MSKRGVRTTIAMVVIYEDMLMLLMLLLLGREMRSKRVVIV